VQRRHGHFHPVNPAVRNFHGDDLRSFWNGI
jgi:hypothetical protein